MHPGQRSDSDFEELDARPADVVPVSGRVSGRGRSATSSSSVIERADPTSSAFRVAATAAVLVIVALAMGDDGPWIVVVPALTALGGAWLDRRIPFSFAEGFIGYCDPPPARGLHSEGRPSSWQRRAPAAH